MPTAWSWRRRCLPAGLLGDRIGRKKLLMCALACLRHRLAGVLLLDLDWRTHRGAGGAGTRGRRHPAAGARRPAGDVHPEERPKAIGIVGGATFIGYPLGPILGGWLLDHYWWGSVFLINVPIAALALAAVTVPDAGVKGLRAVPD